MQTKIRKPQMEHTFIIRIHQPENLMPKLNCLPSCTLCFIDQSMEPGGAGWNAGGHLHAVTVARHVDRGGVGDRALASGQAGRRQPEFKQLRGGSECPGVPGSGCLLAHTQEHPDPQKRPPPSKSEKKSKTESPQIGNLPRRLKAWGR